MLLLTELAPAYTLTVARLPHRVSLHYKMLYRSNRRFFSKNTRQSDENARCRHYKFLYVGYFEVRSETASSTSLRHGIMLVHYFRWGPNGVAMFKENMKKLLELLDQCLPAQTLLIWTSALPVSSMIRGGLIVQQVNTSSRFAHHPLPISPRLLCRLADRFSAKYATF